MTRIAARVVVILIGLVLAVLVPAAPAGAHAYLVKSSPGDGAVLDAAPALLTLSFTESVELSATHIDIVDGDGRRFAVTSITTRSTEGDTESPMDVLAGLPPLPANTYHVTWRTVSSDDLHATTGNLVIGVQRQVAAATRPPGPGGPSPLETLLRGLVLLGLSTAIGGVAMALLAGGTAPALRPALSDVAASGAVLASVAAPAQLWSQVSGVSGGLLWQQATSGRWLLREAGLLGLVAGMLWLRAALRRHSAMPAGPAAVVAAAAGAAALGTELLGHAFGTAVFSIVVGSLHILAAGAWAGGVIAVALAFVPALRAGDDRSSLAALLRSFAVLAVAAVTTLAVTGLLMTGAQVATVDALLSTPYGLLLLAKVAAVIVAGLLGLRTARRLRGAGPVPWRRLTAEATTLVIVLGLAGALASAGPARGPRFATGPELPVVPQVTGQVADLVDTLMVRPNLPGRNVITITVADTRRPALAPITGVSVILRSPDGAQAVHPVVRAADGGWAVTVDDITASGQWSIAVTVQRDGLAPVTDVHPWVVGSDTSAAAPTFSAAPLRTMTTWLALAAGLAGLAAAGLVFRRRRRAPAPVPDATGGTGDDAEPDDPETIDMAEDEEPLAGAARGAA